MKKRIISMLLTVLMIMSLFSGLTVTADAATYNGANTIEYTMAEGDFVLRICQRLGLNYYTCKNAIMILNNITDGQWNKLTVGRTLTLPASDYDALLISNGAGTTAYNSGAAATTATTSTVTGTATTGTATTLSAANTASADTLAYYLVPYTMSYGETVSGVCNALGVNFSIFGPFIKQVNNVSNWTKVRAGDTLIIPTPVAPSVGTTCYGVMEHRVVSSDTAYGIVNSKGVSYTANERLLKVLNQTENLAAIKAGDKFFYPVPLTVSVPGTGNPGTTATTTTTTTVTDGNGTTTTSSTTTSKLYRLTGGMSASDGTMLFFVNSQAVTAAPAGAKVTVVTQTNSGKAIQSLTVKHSDGKADLYLTGDTFVMPSCDVRVDATIQAGHDINITANYSGKAAASVGGISVQSAVKGATVIVKSTDPNYEVSSVYATYKKLISASTKTQLTVSASKAFIMPDADVDIEVVLKPVSTYAFYVNDPVNGSFYLQVNGSAATRAAKGSTVTVVAQPEEGYEPFTLDVKNHNTGTSINVYSNTFTMPAFDVDVEVTFTGKGNNILMMPSQFGNVYAFTTGSPDFSTYAKLEENSITEAPTGTQVFLKTINEDGAAPAEVWTGYKVNYDVVRNSDGLKVSVNKTKMSFTMPKGGVTVTPVITVATPATVTGEIWMNSDTTAATTYRDASFSVTYQDGTKEKRVEYTGKSNPTVQIPVLEYVDLRYDTADGVAFVRYLVTVTGTTDNDENSELLTNEANLNGYFQIPDGTNVTVRIQAYFETGKIAIGDAAITGIGSLGYEILGVSGGPTSSATCAPGDTVRIFPTEGNGYRFDHTKYDPVNKYISKLIVTRKDNGAVLPLNQGTVGGKTYYEFTMPAEGVNIQAVFDAQPFIITMRCLDEVGNPITGTGIWQIAINMVVGAVDLNPAGTQVEVAYGDYITVAMTESGWSKYDMVSFRINDYEYTADQLNYFYNFQMIEDRADNLTITAVLRPRNVAIHNLSAMYDVTRGGVEFFILQSPSRYSDEYRMGAGGQLQYVNRAISGDTVAIVATSVDNRYDLDADDITIYTLGTDADRIIPTEQWIDAFGNPGGPIRVFTFTMPDSDVSVMANFSGAERRITVDVRDANTNAVLTGMVRLAAISTTGATISRDVAANISFDDIAYNSTVSILRSELAVAERKVIKDVEIKTVSGKSVGYTDMSSAGEGIMFTMPNEPIYVLIRMEDFSYGLPVTVVSQLKNGTVVFRRTTNTADPVVSLSDFKAGEIVYVFDQPNEGYKHLGLGDLKILSNGVTNIANIVNVAPGPDGEHVWSFTMPEGTLIFQGEFEKEEAQAVAVTLAFYDENGTATTDGKYKAKVTVNGLSKTFTAADGAGLTFNVLEGQTLTFVSDADGYSITRIQASSGKGVEKNAYTVPDLSEATPAYADTVAIFMKNESNAIKWQATGGSLLFVDTAVPGTSVVAASVGATVEITATPDTGYDALEAVNLIVAKADGSQEIVPVNYTGTTGNITTWEFTMPAGGVLVGATFGTSAKGITFNVQPAGTYVKLTMGEASAVIDGNKYYEIPAGTKLKIESASEGFDKMNITVSSGSGIVDGQNFTVTEAATVDITLSSSKNTITKHYTNGDLNLYSQITPNKELLKNDQANTGDIIYIEPAPRSGYDTLKVENLKVVSTKTKERIAVDTTSYAPYWAFTMPAGGADITAVYEAKPLTITLNITGGNAVVSGRGTVNATQNITAYLNETVTITPAEGYEWQSAMTASVGTANVTAATSATGSATYKVAADVVDGGTEALTITLQPKT